MLIINCNINIVNLYGENESRAGERQIREAFNRLKEDLEEIKMRGEMAILIGDLKWDPMSWA